MPTVAAMIVGPAAQRLAAEQIGGRAEVRFCETLDELSRLAAGEVDVVVADLWDASGAGVFPAEGLEAALGFVPEVFQVGARGERSRIVHENLPSFCMRPVSALLGQEVRSIGKPHRAGYALYADRRPPDGPQT